MPIIAVEITPADSPPALVRALVEACSTTVTSGSCRLAAADPALGEEASAVVRWDDERDRSVRVQVGLRRDGIPEWRGRTLHFAEADPVVERFRSVGLTIATLASEVERRAPLAEGEDRDEASPVTPATPPGGAPSAAPAAPPPSPKADAPKVVTPEPPMRQRASARTPAASDLDRTLWVSGSGFAGPALGDGTVRYGGALDVAARPKALPLFVRLSLDYSARPADAAGLSVQWQTASLGLGAVTRSRWLGLEPRVSAGIHTVHAAVEDPASGRRDSGTQVLVGLRGGLDAVLGAGRFGVLLSLEAWHLAERTDILIMDRVVAASPANGWAGGLGVRYYLE